MDKSQRLNQMYEYARANGICKNKRNFAEVIGIDNGNLSKAFGNDTKYMTDSLLIRVNNTLGNVFSFDWLLTGNGDMLLPYADGDSIHHNSAPVATRGAQINTSTNNNDQLNDQLIAQLKAQITALQSQITTLQAQIDTLQARIADLKNDKEKLYQLLLKQ